MHQAAVLMQFDWKKFIRRRLHERIWPHLVKLPAHFLMLTLKVCIPLRNVGGVLRKRPHFPELTFCVHMYKGVDTSGTDLEFQPVKTANKVMLLGQLITCLI